MGDRDSPMRFELIYSSAYLHIRRFETNRVSNALEGAHSVEDVNAGNQGWNSVQGERQYGEFSAGGCRRRIDRGHTVLASVVQQLMVCSKGR